MAGLTSAGYSAKRLSEIKAELEQSFKNNFGDFINLLPESPLGQFIGIYAEREESLWEQNELVYNSQYPDTAEGVSLDNVVSLTGLVRLPATKSFVTVQLFGTAATSIPIATQFSVLGNSTAQFQSRTAVVLAAGADEVQNVAFSATPVSGSFRLVFDGEQTTLLPHNVTAAAVKAALEVLTNIDTVTVTGSVAAGFDITFTGPQVKKRNQPLITILNNTLSPATVITVTETTTGVSQGSVICDAVVTGPTQANEGTLTVIDTPIFGLSGVYNDEVATIGRDLETDTELRARREETLQVAGAGTVEAIRSRLLSVEGVTDVFVFENVSMINDIDGRPPKSFECVVSGGDVDTITQEIWLAKPAGILAFGQDSYVFTDSQGFSQTIMWSRPTNVPIYVDVTITKDSTFTATAQNIKDAIIAFGSALGIGKDVIHTPQLICAFHEIDGILDIVLKIGIAPSPTLENNIAIAPNEISHWLSGNIVVTIL